MKKITVFLSAIATLLFSFSAHAYTQVSFDFSGITIDPQAKLADYPTWHLAWKSVVKGYSPGWNGPAVSDLQEAIHGLYDGSSPDGPIQMLNVGLTRDNGMTFDPVPTSDSCLVAFKKDHAYVLKVSGTLFAPGGSHDPYLTSLSCQLIEKN